MSSNIGFKEWHDASQHGLGRLGRLGPWWRRWKLARAAKKQVIWLWRLCGSGFWCDLIVHGKLSQLDTLITTCTSSRNGEAEELQLVSVQYITKVYPVRCPQAGILVIMPCALSMRHIVLPKKSLSEQWWRKQNAPTGFKPAPFASAAWFLFCSHTFALGVLPWAAFYVFACVAFGSRRRATAGEIVSAPSNFWSIFWSSTGPRPQRVGNVSVTCRSSCFRPAFLHWGHGVLWTFWWSSKDQISGEKWPNLRVDMWYDMVWPCMTVPIESNRWFQFSCCSSCSTPGIMMSMMSNWLRSFGGVNANIQSPVSLPLVFRSWKERQKSWIPDDWKMRQALRVFALERIYVICCTLINQE